MARECAFCPTTANLTGEHLWSAWIGDALGIRKYTFVRKENDGTAKTWSHNELDAKARVVCANCNNGWMSDLEGESKAFLHDMVLHCSPTELQPDQIRLLAAVAFKNTVVADHMHANRRPFFTLAERRTFAKTRRVPTGVQMWLASTDIQGGIFKCGYIVTEVGSQPGFEINHFTYGAGHVVTQTAASRWKKLSFRRRFLPPVLTQSPEWNPASVPFWPPKNDRPINWPPDNLMGQEVIDPFVKRWQNLESGF